MFNITKVNSQIRKSGHIFWYRDEYSDYICNGHWIIKTDFKKEEYRKMLSVLVERFGTIPKVGEELKKIARHKKDKISKSEIKPSWLELLEKEDLEKLKDTQLTYLSAGTSCRIFKGKGYVYIDSKFIEMIDANLPSIIFEGNGHLDPVFLRKEEDLIMLSPVRMGEESKYLKDITIKENEKDSLGLQSQKSQ